MEDLRNASELLLKALEVREKYMKYSHQSYPNLVKRFLMSMGSAGSPLPGNEAYDDGTHSLRATLEGTLNILFECKYNSVTFILNPMNFMIMNPKMVFVY